MSSKSKNTHNQSNPQTGKLNGVAAKTPSKLHSLIQYFELSKKELFKVSWPTKKEIKSTSFAILALVGVMSVFLGLVDFMLTKIIETILSIGL